jgi:hypothetical protein
MDAWTFETDRRRHECLHLGGAEVRAGDCVRLQLKQRSDVFDLVLDGLLATVEAIEEDLEGRVFLAVTINDDPGRDLGQLRQIGHRFFFLPSEVVPHSEAQEGRDE